MAPRGRKPKPTSLKLIEGNRGRRPLNDEEPQYDLTSLAPPHELNDIAKAQWERVAPLLRNTGVLTDVDTGTLAGYCAAYSTFVTAENALKALADRDPVFKGLIVKTGNGTMVQNPLVGTRNSAIGIMNRLAVELGMTPSSRTRIKVSDAQKPGSDKHEDMAAKYGF